MENYATKEFKTVYEKQTNWFNEFIYKLNKCLLIFRSKQFILIDISIVQNELRMTMSRNKISEDAAMDVFKLHINAIIEDRKAAKAVNDLMNNNNNN